MTAMTDDTVPTQELAEEIARSVRAHEDDDGGGPSRRTLLGAVAGGTLLAAGGSGLVFGNEHEDDEDESDDHGGPGATFDDVSGTDVDVLNYALTLEHLENVFYREATEMFSADDFANADALQSMSEERRRQAYEQVVTVGEHEASHVTVLTQAVELLGGDPAPECTYAFGVETVGDFLGLAQVLENTGVGAYAGAAPYIQSPDLLSAALSIHSVEAKHAAVFNSLNDSSPFPNAYDEALSQEEVLEAAGPLIESCPGDEGGDGGDSTETETSTPTETGTTTETETSS